MYYRSRRICYLTAVIDHKGNSRIRLNISRYTHAVFRIFYGIVKYRNVPPASIFRRFSSSPFKRHTVILNSRLITGLNVSSSVGPSTIDIITFLVFFPIFLNPSCASESSAYLNSISHCIYFFFLSSQINCSKVYITQIVVCFNILQPNIAIVRICC